MKPFNGMVFLDIETTGLKPAEGFILEIGFALVNRDFEIEHEKSWLIQGPVCASYLENRSYNEFIGKMHGPDGSGLLPELEHIRDYDGHAANVLHAPQHRESEIGMWLQSRGLFQKDQDKLPIYGSSVHFDRTWLAQHMPTLNDMFHYRNVDSSSDREFIKLMAPEFFADMDAVAQACIETPEHRVLPDIHSSIAQRRILWNGVYAYNIEVFESTIPR